MKYGIASVRPLPFKFPPVKRKGMTAVGKMSYEALPQDARDHLDQYIKPPKQYDDDEDVWFCHAWKSKPKIPQEAPKPLPYGTLACFRPKSHLDFHDPSCSKVSDEEFNAWKRYRESLPPHEQSWLNRYIDSSQNQAKNKREYEGEESDRKKHNSNMRTRKYEEEEFDRKKHNSSSRRKYEEEESERKIYNNSRKKKYEEEEYDRKKHNRNTRKRNYEESSYNRRR